MSKPARDAAQNGAVTYASVNRTPRRECIQMRRRNVAAIAAKLAISEVVDEQKDDVRREAIRIRSRYCRRVQNEEHGAGEKLPSPASEGDHH